jgi:ABC-2 type transport system ATP-binding protein
MRADPLVARAPAVAVDRLIVDRGGRRALDSLSFSIRRGSVTGLVGPSGSGKTTLIRAIVGTQIVASGNVTVLGAAAGGAALRHPVAWLLFAGVMRGPGAGYVRRAM